MRFHLAAAALLIAAVLAPADPADAAALDVAGDIAYGAEGMVHLVDVDDGATVDLAAGGSPMWAPDGRDLAYVANDGGQASLFVLSSGVVVAPVENLDWQWSPDGESIVWVSHTGVQDVWVTDVATGQTTNLTNGAIEASNPQWTPDARTIVFESDGRIWTIPAAGGALREVVAGHSPSVSPDGSRIAYQWMDGDFSEPPLSRVLSHVALDGSDPHHVATLTTGCGFRTAHWSPDGSRIAYGVWCGGSPVIQAIEFFVVPASGSGAPTSIGSGSAWRAAGPFWSPTGDRLALVDGGWSSWDVTVVDPDGSARTVLTDSFPFQSCTADPSWSPDGSRLVFEVYPTGCGQPAMPPFPPSDVYVVAADGSDLHRIGSGSGPAWRPAHYEVGLVDPSTGIWHLNGIAPFYFGNPGDVPFLGDWDGDGVATPGLYRQSDGFVYLRNSNTQGVADVRFFFGNPGDVPLAGDFDGDGFDTVSLYRPSTGEVFVINELGSDDGGLGAAEVAYYFGNPGDKPFAGDFDGDGTDTVGLHRESTGFVYLRNSHTPGVADAAFYFGDPGDRLVAGDWVGAGSDTVGVYRPSATMFHLRFTNSQGVADASFVMGRPAWLPVAGPPGD